MGDNKELDKIWRQLFSEQMMIHRGKLNLTQREVAEAVRCEEIHYGRIERGEKTPNGLLTLLIIDKLEMNFDELITLYKEQEIEYFRRYE